MIPLQTPDPISVELQCFDAFAFSVKNTHNSIERASCEDIFELRVPLQANNPCLAAIQNLGYQLLLTVVDHNFAIEKPKR